MTNTEPKQLTVRELVAELQKLDPDAPIYFDDAEYGPTHVEAVVVTPAREIPGYPAGRVYEIPAMVVIR